MIKPLMDRYLYKEGIRFLVKSKDRDYNKVVAIEECSELIKAMTKIIRMEMNGEENEEKRFNLIEEIADVIICISILREIYNITDGEIHNMLQMKMERNLRRIEQENKKVNSD